MFAQAQDFKFEVDAEMIVYGVTNPDTHVSLRGEPVRIRPDGTFTVRMSLPNQRQVIPVVASAANGGEQRTIVLAVERNTKVMEPVAARGERITALASPAARSLTASTCRLSDIVQVFATRASPTSGHPSSLPIRLVCTPRPRGPAG